METALALYEEIRGLTGLLKLIKERTQENLFLEFKTKKNRSIPDLEDGDCWQLSRALSGFANSDGGVLIWGVETDGEERASKRKPISSVAEFESRLKKSLLNSVQPFVDGVQMECILEGVGRKDGYLKILIPRSEKTPHRALRANREYFRRSTEGFYRLEHFDLEDAFGRRPLPVLNLQIDLKPRSGDDPHEEIYFLLRNDGRGIAKHVGFLCEFAEDVQIAQARGKFSNATVINGGRPIVSYASDDSVVHTVPIIQRLGPVTIKRPAKGSPLKFHARVYCEGMALKEFEDTVSVVSR